MANKFLILTIFALIATDAFAIPERRFRDLNLPTQELVEHQSVVNPAAAGTTQVLSGSAGNTSAAAATVSTFAAQPDVARNLVMTPGGSTGDVAACNVVVSGTNIKGASITETFAFTNNQSAATTGAKAFLSVSSVAFPANCEDGAFGATWSAGYGEKLGVDHCLDQAGNIFFSTLNGAKEATAPTMVVDADEVEKNTADYNGTMNGSNDFELLYFQNFVCQ